MPLLEIRSLRDLFADGVIDVEYKVAFERSVA